MIREAALVYMKRLAHDEQETPATASATGISFDDFVAAMRMIAPSSKRSGHGDVIEVPNTPWDAIGGLADVKAVRQRRASNLRKA